MSKTTEQLRDRATERERLPMRLDMPSAEGGGISPVKLTAKTNDTTYTGNVYGNGTDVAATETAVTIRVEGIATGETLRFNIRFAAIKQPWAGVEQWTLIEVPRLI